ncbi:MAG TPA: oligoribonuclease [Nitrospiria bacterium]|nr:oligoribonuclease [Nitrospiria bacterium]
MSAHWGDLNLIWLDLEMTGLEPEIHTILEIATLVTDSQLTVLAEGPTFAIRQEERVLEEMESWSRETHTRSGLLKRVEESKISMAEAEQQTLSFVEKYCPAGKSPLCGNSVGHDRRFLVRYMPTLHRYLHYRNIDVSTVKELIQRWYPSGLRPPEKKGSHLAMEDIRESVKELIFYREQYFIKPIA